MLIRKVMTGCVVQVFDTEKRGFVGQFFVVGDGSFIPAKIIKIPIEIGNKKIIADIAFSEKLNIGFNLLGRKDVFEHFDEVAFNEKKKEVVFRIKP